jgi:hypothetical protein
MKCVSAAIAFVLAGLLAVGAVEEKGVGGSSFHKNDITYSTSIPTPHVKWATKLPGGPIRGFFIPSIQYGRDMVELMQRLDLAPTTVSIDRNWDTNCWGIGDYYGHEYRGDRDDFQIVYSYVEKDLTGPASFEVLVIPGLNGWSRMTRATRDAILRRVSEGAGLVLIHPYVGDVKNHPFKGDEREGDTRLWDISPLVDCPDDTPGESGYPDLNKEALTSGKWEMNPGHFITAGQPVSLLPEGNMGRSFYKYKARGNVLIKSGEYPIAAFRNYGKGRVVAFAYLEDGFIPSAANPGGISDLDGYPSSTLEPASTGIYWDYWEYYYSLLTRAVVWAAGRDSTLEIRSLKAEPAGDASLRFVLSTPSPLKIEIDVAAKSAVGQKCGKFKKAVDLPAGETALTVPASALRPPSGWPGGKVIFDMILRDAAAGATLNWGSADFDYPRRATITGVSPATDVYRRGETLSAVIRTAGDLSDLKLRFKVSDDLDRTISSESRPARPERYFYCGLQDFLGKYAYLTAELEDSRGAIVDQLHAQPVLVVQESRRQKEFNPLVAFGTSKHFFHAARMQQVREGAADTGFTWGGNINNSLNVPRGAFGVYWYDRGPTTPEAMEKAIAEYQRTEDFETLQYLTKKELYKRTGDTKFLARSPSFLDSAFISRLKNIVFAVARGKARYNMDYYFVGDEGSLTSYTDPYDFDWSPDALMAFRHWLEQEYGSLEALNRSWQSRFTRWEDVLPFTAEQALKTRNYAPWADHRAFMEVSFAGAYQSVRDAVVAGDPEAHIALSGTQVTTAYDGCDWYRLDRIIDDFLSYDGGNQWDLHRSFAKPGSMIGFWTGYESRGLAIQNAIWTAAIHNVLHPNIFWFLSYLNPDFTYAQGARDMGETFKVLKFGGVGKLLMESERLGDGIALHYSMPSVHAASITLNHPERGRREIARDFPANRDGWVRTIKDLGLQFDFVAYEQIEKGKLSEYRLLILPFSMAISPAEAKAIGEFAQNGGIVFADAAAGMMDNHCAWVPGGMLNDLFGISAASSPERRLAGSNLIEENQDGDVTSQKKTPGITDPLSVSEEGKRWGLRTENLGGVEAVETGIKARAGTALVKIGETDAVIVRQVGKGWAIYLNALLDRYPDLRAKGFGGEGYRSLIGGILAHLNVKPAIQVLTAEGKPLSQAQVVRYRFGDSEILAVVKEIVGVEGVAGRDGVTAYNDAKSGKVAREELTIRLPERRFVTDVTANRSLGQGEAVGASITSGGALVLGLSRSADSLNLSGPVKARLGEHLSFRIQSAVRGKHLLRCQFFAPDGSFLHVYARSVLMDGVTGTVAFPSALNDMPGRYRLVITDLISGAAAESTFALEQ